jgi:integrase
MPKVVKERKSITERIVTKDDIENVLRYIKRAENKGNINSQRSAQYSAFVIFGAFTGQRSLATMANLTVGQFREALQSKKPVLQVETSQDKTRMSHYVPLHPQVVKAVQPLLKGRKKEERVFAYVSFLMWIKRQKIPMSRFKGHFVLGDLRKFAEQHGDIIQWEHSNRAYILTHGVSGVDWTHYRHPLPETVFDIYMRYWGGV